MIATAAAIAVYVVGGFLLVPFVLERYLPAIASAQLQRPVTVGAVRFNPLWFTLEADDLSVKEAQGEPLLGLGRFHADLEIKSVVRRALIFREIRVEKPYLRAVMGADRRLNLAKLADAFRPNGEGEEADDNADLPHLMIDHLALADGTIDWVDESRGRPVSERIEAIDLKLEAVSTLPDQQASHHIQAMLGDGSVLDWHGQFSFGPFGSTGEVRLDGLKLPTLWPFLKDRFALQQPEGKIAFSAGYRWRRDGDVIDFSLHQIDATVAGLKLAPAGGKEPIVTLDEIRLSRGTLGLADQAVKIPELAVQKGKLKTSIDDQGMTDWLRLVKSSAAQPRINKPGTAAATQDPGFAPPWHIDVDALKLGGVALQLTDASRRVPIDFTATAQGLGLKLALEVGSGGPRFTVSQLGGEMRGIALREIGGKEPMLAVETVELADGAVDSSRRIVKLSSVLMRKGSVRAEVDDHGALNWQEIAETASSSGRGRAPSAAAHPQRRMPQPAPWRVEVDRAKIEQIGVRYADGSRKTPVQLEIASLGLGFRAAVEAGAGEPKVNIDGLAGELKGAVLRERLREKPLASLESLALSGGRIDLAANLIAVQQIHANGGDAAIERDEKGAIRLAEALAPKDRGKTTTLADQAGPAPGAEAKPWHFEVEQTALKGFHALVADRSLAPPLTIELTGAELQLTHLTNDGRTPMVFGGKLHIVQGGDLFLQGSASSAGDRGEADVRLERLDLAWLQPYAAQVGALKLESGTLSTHMRLGFQQKAGKTSVTAKGEMASANLMLREAKTGKRLASWSKLTTEGVDFSLVPDKLAIKEIRALGPGANVEIFADRSTNIEAIFRNKKGAATARTPKPTVGSGNRAADKPFAFSVQRVKVDEGIVDFSDVSLVFPFKTRIQNLGGTISGISNAPSARTLLKLDGRVDEYGEANLEGTLDLMQHQAYSDLTLIFRNVDMASLSPYSGTFAGRRILSGRMNSELQYKIEDSRLHSHGEIELDRLTLGAKVDSPKARSLPLDLAVALLTDNSGKIKVSIPVEGNLDSPEFTYGSVIWDAIVTTITKAVTAPFTALAGAMGGGGQEIGEIFFIPAKNGLPPAEIEKLKKLALGLSTRPNVFLKVQGTFDPKLDAEALKSWDLRTEVTEKLGITVLPGEDPGPVAFDSAKSQKALEDVADERGTGALTSARTAFRDRYGREPKRIGALSSWLHRASEDAQFYRLLFDQLVVSAALPPKALEALGARRAQAIVKELAIYKGIDPSRLRLEKVAAARQKEGRVPSKLELAAGAR